MNQNIRLTEQLAILAALDPASQAVGTVTTPWVSLGNFDSVLAILDVGVFGASGTVGAALLQATTNTGTGSKAVADVYGNPKAISALAAAGGNNRQVTIECRDTDLDANNGFGYVALQITVGAAASILSALLLGGNSDYAPASAFNASTVAQQV